MSENEALLPTKCIFCN